ncbi:hypothetical protein A3I99_01630 [Candidatus Kaiserbacteria bacterium RIFCSPLOWO2_02_FULL_45_11b]|uniref:Restriction endonuclease n=1 Tax=Candidatus Kaiserbacteria bacterium RIFCSPLOWO2_12_FULL_45_26 TaxID=1798525 RepID=A0A1F6FFX3_9BACT|nr:MAG: hypothetical protein A2Z56_03970 [Candidatus Kaiserbacteria bacterium RIFCSPHIGHO2_12_45_16]OGG70531.1 MAG: hypothetical protein A2929_04875 [Candidatus Kaiserbacteria bacterium RIFCSPLOWO2_01_FULL_45_25]OGG81016.1 MAG: hypothetical protein A3I99_01630 [Candidatus Kaiserbacteria bacterium RIFCSPLOWO2_02_FULL_45_11b]OGG84759.1 MAG: hypothetical protein A3G90_01580 [Candidatus Kaiserbacteria bacterium RIFCSPLOWO2_12_FULL_45_26]
MYDTDYNRYIEKLLNDHFDASLLLNHELTKGQVRERFIRDQINSQFGGTTLCTSGVMSVREVRGQVEYKQADLVIFPHSIRRREIGAEYLIDPKDVLLIADVKSSVEKRDIVEWNKIAEKIHKREKKENWNKDTQVGVISYRYSKVDFRSLLKQFGFVYSKDYGVYIYKRGSEEISNLDFLFILHNVDGEDRRLLLRRNKKAPRQKDFIPYTLLIDQAASDGFWEMLYSLTGVYSQT